MAKKKDRDGRERQAGSNVIERAEAEGLDLIRFLYVDHGGVVRGKATSRPRLAERLGTGIGLTLAMQAMTALDELQPVAGMGPVGEIRLVPDPGSFVALPYAPGAGAMVADMIRLDGEPWEACPRTFLRRAVAELAGEGYALVAAFEPEFTLGRLEPVPEGDPGAEDDPEAAALERLVPIDRSLCFSSTGFGLAHDYTLELVRALQAQGLVVEQYYPELGHGQQELSIRHAPALRAADNQVWYRETVRGVAMRQGLWASLAPKPIPDQAGNGAHLHASLWDAGESRNVFLGPGDRHGLSDLAYHFIGGLLAHLPALVALTCGSVNSYRRLVPSSWSGAYACFGMDNREAAVRIASPMWGVEEASTNLELKCSDATGNPYLALGAYIHAGLDGIRNKLDPGKPVEVDPHTLSAASRRRRGIRRLPSSLTEALDALEGDELLMEALGPLRRSAYLAVKRAEAAAFAAHGTAFECYHYSTKF
ncbi:MAG TPA: glutamine synthetase family protein [Actinomycetes bacterium]|jgi:glutamine synthetase|nr:glutamine synthetase family protein [Actinomycetes bacterium]